MRMRIHFLGGAREVGRVSILLETRSLNILIDCGVKLGGGDDIFPLDPPVPPDVVLISHAHLDHVGYLPALVKKYRCTVLATMPTQDLAELLNRDMLKLYKERGLEPPYSNQDIMDLRKYFLDAEYRVPYRLNDDVCITFFRSGHILGSSMIKIKVGDVSVLYTGDFSVTNTKTLEKADTAVGDVDILLMESTYGHHTDRHPSRKRIEQEFFRSVMEVVESGGKVLIPAFAVGRAQEVMLVLESRIRCTSQENTKLRSVFIDGMIKQVNDLYRRYWIYLSREIRNSIRYTGYDPFRSEIFRYVGRREDIVRSEEPLVIVTTSGMLEGGPALFYLKEFGEDPNNLICLTGYQVPGTIGWQLLNRNKRVTLPDGTSIDVNADVKLFEFSAHADQPNLFRFVTMFEDLEYVFCIHGEEHKVEDLSERLRQRNINAQAPKMGEVFEI